MLDIFFLLFTFPDYFGYLVTEVQKISNIFIKKVRKCNWSLRDGNSSFFFLMAKT